MGILKCSDSLLLPMLTEPVEAVIRRWPLPAMALVLALALVQTPVHASLEAYDALLASEAGSGPEPIARLTNVVALSGSNRVPFDFGASSGDATMEFIL